MFEEIEVPKKRITMICQEGGDTVQVTREFDVDTAWNQIAGQFYQFLAGLGYHLDSEDVSAEW